MKRGHDGVFLIFSKYIHSVLATGYLIIDCSHHLDTHIHGSLLIDQRLGPGGKTTSSNPHSFILKEGGPCDSKLANLLLTRCSWAWWDGSGVSGCLLVSSSRDNFCKDWCWWTSRALDHASTNNFLERQKATAYSNSCRRWELHALQTSLNWLRILAKSL